MPDPIDLVGSAHEHVFAAMGSHAHLVVVGDAALLRVGVERVAELERRWSRFLPDSEVSALNARAGSGAPVAVSADTFLLVSRAVEAWALTGGLYDPTVLPALRAAGYDRTFTDPACGVHRAGVPAPSAVPAPGPGGIELEPALRTVRLPAGVALDPGGLGKGLAADLVAAELLAAGARGACVNLGGDVRVAGRAPTPHGWLLGVDDPLADARVVPVRLGDEAVVTSTRRVRRWRRGDREMHHLIDPRTGAPAASPLHTVSVVAGQAWWAEVLAKAALVGGPVVGPALLRRAGVAALVAADTGSVLELGGWAERVAAAAVG
jgi:thiamine biosynthesis lipoprotein